MQWALPTGIFANNSLQSKNPIIHMPSEERVLLPQGSWRVVYTWGVGVAPKQKVEKAEETH